MAQQNEQNKNYRERAEKHPLTHELVTGAAYGAVKLATIGGDAPPTVRPWIGDALDNLTQLGIYVSTALEEADDECINRIELKVRERWVAVQQEINRRPEFTQGHAMQHMFGLQDRKRKIGFDVPADLPQSNR